MKCPKCGNNNNEDALYCSVCYEALKKEHAPGNMMTVTELILGKKDTKVEVRIFGSKIISRIILYAVLIIAILYAVRVVNKYNWTGYSFKITKDNFTIYSDLPENKIQKYLGICILFKKYFNDNVLPVNDKVLKIYLFGNRKEYDLYCEKIKYKNTEYGFYMKGNGLLIVNCENGIGTMLHEMTHYLIDAGKYEFSGWMEEGLSALFEKFIGYYENNESNSISFGYFSPWRFSELKQFRSSGSGGIDDLNMNDSISGCFMLFLHKNGKLKEFIESYLKNKDHKKAISEVFNEDIAGVDKKWLEWVDNQPIDDNVEFVQASEIFDTKSEFDKFIESSNVVWNEKEKIYKYD